MQHNTTEPEHLAEASTEAASTALSTEEVPNGQDSALHPQVELDAWRAGKEGRFEEKPQGKSANSGRNQRDATVVSGQGLQQKSISRTERSSKRTKGSKGKAKVVDISEPPVYGSAPLIAETRSQRKAASEPGSLQGQHFLELMRCSLV